MQGAANIHPYYTHNQFSIKSALYPDYMNDPLSIKQYFTDPVLASPAGHELLADVLIAYLESQICTAWSVATGQAYDTVPLPGSANSGDAHGLFGGVGLRKGVPPEEQGGSGDVDADGNRIKVELPNSGKASSPGIYPQLRVPAGRINTRPNSGRAFEEVAPFCVSANDLINPLPPSLFYGSGWSVFHPAGGASALQTNGHYWASTLPTSRLRIPLLIGAGDVGVYYLKDPISQVGEGSAIECWVDDNYAGAKVIENAADVGEPTAAYVPFFNNSKLALDH